MQFEDGKYLRGPPHFLWRHEEPGDGFKQVKRTSTMSLGHVLYLLKPQTESLEILRSAI